MDTSVRFGVMRRDPRGPVVYRCECSSTLSAAEWRREHALTIRSGRARETARSVAIPAKSASSARGDRPDDSRTTDQDAVASPQRAAGPKCASRPAAGTADVSAARLVADGADPRRSPSSPPRSETPTNFDLADFAPTRSPTRGAPPRRECSSSVLKATRAGLLEFRWKLLCPLCRGPARALDDAGDVGRTRTATAATSISPPTSSALSN